MPRFTQTNRKIYEIILNMAEVGEVLDGLPLAELFREIRKQGIASHSSAISRHLKVLEDQGKIKIEHWHIKVI